MLLSGVPQGSILGPLLFNIYICDMFFETPENIDFAKYADDNTPYTYSSKIEQVLIYKVLQKNSFPGFLQITQYQMLENVIFSIVLTCLLIYVLLILSSQM